MKFKTRHKEDPEINLIPFIDVLLVVIIFLLLTTSYTRVSLLQIQLPEASKQVQDLTGDIINVDVSADGTISINQKIFNRPTTRVIMQELQTLSQGVQDPVVIVNAHELATHGSVVHVMDATKLAGISKLNFSTTDSLDE